MEHLWGITHLPKISLWGITHLRKFFYGASLILRKYYGALLTSPDKLWGISQNRKIEKCDPPPYHDLLMTAPLHSHNTFSCCYGYQTISFIQVFGFGMQYRL